MQCRSTTHQSTINLAEGDAALAPSSHDEMTTQPR
jgi:hypothetical protein